jgi:cytidyltransferase-like protein
MNVCLGGTFDPLHKGHQVLIKKALQVAGTKGKVFIGITSETMKRKKGGTASFEQRKRSVEEFLRNERASSRTIIQPITDPYGPAITGDFDAIVVTPETRPTAEEINNKRRQQNKKALRIISIPFVLAEDGCPISSTRIRNREIDENGTLLKKE